ncbi:FhaA domain-containing protein [Atopobium fossor]|uniref:FhaA domain-containing protein n=1 Tax=Atopobium fossor TaxID=39487 RepID=UPI0004080D09|nr:FhaA domain-containing protein [Atopobium fossor]
MNFLNTFESRIASIFGASAEGQVAPFSFKKLAKKTLRELKNETLIIDDVDTAPALFTILVAADDDLQMRPFYSSIATELSQLLEAHAIQKNLSLVGTPVVRFMVDPSLRRGKYAIFAENVEAHVLERLRMEEDQFLGDKFIEDALNNIADQGTNHPSRIHNHSRRQKPSADPLPKPRPAVPLDDSEAGLNVLPASETNNPVVLNAGFPSVPMPTPTPIIPQASAAAAHAASADVAANVAAGVAAANAASVAASAVSTASAAAPASTDIPKTLRRNVPLVNSRNHRSAAASTRTVQALLINRISGKTYTVHTSGAIVGRERASANIVLHDPNVSRSHAQISFDGISWHVRDLNSTNGTQVNDVDIDECILRSGDMITFGLTTLEFRED